MRVLLLFLFSFCISMSHAESQNNPFKGVSFIDPLVLDVSNQVVNSQIKTVLLEKMLRVDNMPIRCLMIAYVMPIKIEKQVLQTQIYIKPNLCGITVPMVKKEYPIENYQSLFESYTEDTKTLYKENPFKYEQVPYSFTQLLKQSDKQYVLINHL